jgi:hypothetical protein
VFVTLGCVLKVLDSVYLSCIQHFRNMPDKIRLQRTFLWRPPVASKRSVARRKYFAYVHNNVSPTDKTCLDLWEVPNILPGQKPMQILLLGAAPPRRSGLVATTAAASKMFVACIAVVVMVTICIVCCIYELYRLMGHSGNTICSPRHS